MKIKASRGEFTLNKPTNSTLANFRREWYRKWNRVLASITCVLIFFLLIGIVMKSIWNEREREKQFTQQSQVSVVFMRSGQNDRIVVKSKNRDLLDVLTSKTEYSPSDQPRCSNQNCNVFCSKIVDFSFIDSYTNGSEFHQACPSSIQVTLTISNSSIATIESNCLFSNPNLEIQTLTIEGTYELNTRIKTIQPYAFAGYAFRRTQNILFSFVQIDRICSDAFLTPDLIDLSFRDVSLDYIEKGFSTNFNRLKILQFHKSISYAILENITALTKYPELEILDLRGGTVEKLTFQMFRNMKILHTLTMSTTSNLRYIEGGTFKNNPKLLKLDLQDCDLEMLTEDIFGYRVSDQLQFHINNNPWYCNCTLYWLKKMWIGTNIVGVQVPSCESSSAHSNQGKTFCEAEFCESEASELICQTVPTEPPPHPETPPTSPTPKPETVTSITETPNPQPCPDPCQPDPPPETETPIPPTPDPTYTPPEPTETPIPETPEPSAPDPPITLPTEGIPTTPSSSSSEETTTEITTPPERLQFDCLPGQKVAVRNSNIVFNNRPLVNFDLKESNGMLTLTIHNYTQKRYTVFWINNERKLLIDVNNSNILYDAKNQSGCLTKIQTENVVLPRLRPANAYTICIIEASEDDISPIDCKAITLKPEPRYQAWLHKKDRAPVLVTGLICVSIVLLSGASIGIFITKRFPEIILKGNKKQPFNRSTREFESLKSLPGNTLRVAFGSVRLSPKLQNHRSRSHSEGSVCSSETSYVVPPVPTALELLTWKMERLRDRYEVPPPLPPHPLEKLHPQGGEFSSGSNSVLLNNSSVSNC